MILKTIYILLLLLFKVRKKNIKVKKFQSILQVIKLTTRNLKKLLKNQTSKNLNWLNKKII